MSVLKGERAGHAQAAEKWGHIRGELEKQVATLSDQLGRARAVDASSSSERERLVQVVDRGGSLWMDRDEQSVCVERGSHSHIMDSQFDDVMFSCHRSVRV